MSVHTRSILTLLYLQPFSLLFLIYTFIQGVSAVQTNVTFDDAVPSTVNPQASISYNPSDQWSAGQICQGCHAKPDASLAFDGTWHDTTYDTSHGTPQPSINFNFVGTAIYVYCIMANTLPSTGTHSKFSFVLDGQPAGPNFIHNPDQTSNYEYNVLVFSQENLQNTHHSFTLLPMPGSGVDGSTLVLFDYITYTTETEDASPTPGPTAVAKPAAAGSNAGTTNGVLSLSNANPSNANPPNANPSNSKGAPVPTHPGTSPSSPSQSSSSSNSSSGSNSAQGNTSTDTSKSSNIGPIVGGIIGAFLGIALIIIAGYFFMKRRMKKDDEKGVIVEPYQFAMYGSGSQHSGSVPRGTGTGSARFGSGIATGGGSGVGGTTFNPYANVPTYSPPPTAAMGGRYTPILTTALALQSNRGTPPPPPPAPPAPAGPVVNDNMERWRQNVVPPNTLGIPASNASVYNRLSHSRQGSHGLDSIADDAYSAILSASGQSSNRYSETVSSETRNALQARVDELEIRLGTLTASYPQLVPSPPPQPPVPSAGADVSDLPYAANGPPSPPPRGTAATSNQIAQGLGATRNQTLDVLHQNALMHQQIQQLQQEIQRLRTQQLLAATSPTSSHGHQIPPVPPMPPIPMNSMSMIPPPPAPPIPPLSVNQTSIPQTRTTRPLPIPGQDEQLLPMYVPRP